MRTKEILTTLIDEEGFLRLVGDELLDKVIKGKLDELAKSTDTAIDDAMVAMIYPPLKAAVMDYLSGKAEELSAP